MKAVLIFGFAAVALLFVGFLYIEQRSDNFFLATFQSNDEKVQKEVVKSERASLLEAEKCHSDCPFGFEFLKNLAKFHKLGDKKGPQHYLFQRPFAGAIRQGTLCADSMGALEGGKVGISRCHGRGVNQEWTFTEMKQIRNEGRGKLCLTMVSQLQRKITMLLFQNCSNVDINQKWQFDNERKQIMPIASPRLCVARKQSILVLVKCDESSKKQKWHIVLTEILNMELHYLKNS